jgi:uncharacterized protein (TIGR02147 family)
MDIFKHQDYRKFLREQLKSLPKKGYGQLSKLARHLAVQSAYLSQVFQGTKTLSPEQALATADYFHLGEKETEYFHLLVQLDRAGSKELRSYLMKKITALQNENLDIKNRVTIDTRMSAVHQATFYSDWSYSAVRQATAIPGVHHIEKIAEVLQLPAKRVAQVLEFLVEAGLCNLEGGEFKIGARRTHLESSSPLVKLHHQNWRTRAIEQIFDPWESKLHYSSPMTVANKDAVRIRQTIVDMIEQVGKIADASTSEEIVCFNVDWYRVSKRPS